MLTDEYVLLWWRHEQALIELKKLTKQRDAAVKAARRWKEKAKK